MPFFGKNLEAGKKVGRVVVMEKTHIRKDGTFIDPSIPPKLVLYYDFYILFYPGIVECGV